MLTHQELATIRAALHYWRDEIAPAGRKLARKYCDDDVDPLITPAQITRLAGRFTTSNIRYATVRGREFTSPLLDERPESADSNQTYVSIVTGLDADA